MRLFRSFVACLAALCLLAAWVRAESSGTPVGPVILTVVGLDTGSFPGGEVAFDVDMLRALGEVEMTTSTIWTDGANVYTGISLKTLAAALEIENDLLKLHALNDYAIEFPASEAYDDGPILAYLTDGAQMSVRDKGPIWLIYPFDSNSEYRTDTAFSRSIWQLDRIEVLR
jgi:hypothetical protein